MKKYLLFSVLALSLPVMQPISGMSRLAGHMKQFGQKFKFSRPARGVAKLQNQIKQVDKVLPKAPKKSLNSLFSRPNTRWARTGWRTKMKYVGAAAAVGGATSLMLAMKNQKVAAEEKLPSIWSIERKDLSETLVRQYIEQAENFTDIKAIVEYVILREPQIDVKRRMANELNSCEKILRIYAQEIIMNFVELSLQAQRKIMDCIQQDLNDKVLRDFFCISLLYHPKDALLKNLKICFGQLDEEDTEKIYQGLYEYRCLYNAPGSWVYHKSEVSREGMRSLFFKLLQLLPSKKDSFQQEVTNSLYAIFDNFEKYDFNSRLTMWRDNFFEEEKSKQFAEHAIKIAYAEPKMKKLVLENFHFFLHNFDESLMSYMLSDMNENDMAIMFDSIKKADWETWLYPSGFKRAFSKFMTILERNKLCKQIFTASLEKALSKQTFDSLEDVIQHTPKKLGTILLLTLFHCLNQKNASQSERHVMINLDNLLYKYSAIYDNYEYEFKQLLQVYEAEKKAHAQNPDVVHWYHGQCREILWFEEVYTKLREVFDEKIYKDFLFIRFGKKQESFFKEAIEYQNTKEHLTFLAQNGEAFFDDILFLNSALFGNMTHAGSSSVYFFLTNESMNRPCIRISSLLNDNKLYKYYDAYEARLNSLKSDFGKLSKTGVLLHIEASKEVVKNVMHVYPTNIEGFKRSYKIDKEKTDNVEELHEAMRTKPHLIKNRDKMQFGAPVDPIVLDDWYKAGVKITPLYGADKEKYTQIEKGLRELFSDMRNDFRKDLEAQYGREEAANYMKIYAMSPSQKAKIYEESVKDLMTRPMQNCPDNVLGELEKMAREKVGQEQRASNH